MHAECEVMSLKFMVSWLHGSSSSFGGHRRVHTQEGVNLEMEAKALRERERDQTLFRAIIDKIPQKQGRCEMEAREA